MCVEYPNIPRFLSLSFLETLQISREVIKNDIDRVRRFRFINVGKVCSHLGKIIYVFFVIRTEPKSFLVTKSFSYKEPQINQRN